MLRLRNFTIGSKISDEEILSDGGLQRILELVGVIKPFVSLRGFVLTNVTDSLQISYLNDVVMPDEVSELDRQDSTTSDSEQSDENLETT